MRIGMGYDVHRLQEGCKLIMGGVEIPYEKGLLGHSDADVLVHAVMDALLGAAALGDIGKHFPDTDPAYKGISAVGAFPIAKTHLPGSLAASSILTHARVVCLSFASLTTSGSLIKQRAVPPKLSRVLLWMPERAICVSVTIPAPALNASTAFVTAPSEKTRLST